MITEDYVSKERNVHNEGRAPLLRVSLSIVRLALNRGPSLGEEYSDVCERKNGLDYDAHQNARPCVPRREFVDPK